MLLKHHSQSVITSDILTNIQCSTYAIRSRLVQLIGAIEKLLKKTERNTKPQVSETSIGIESRGPSDNTTVTTP